MDVNKILTSDDDNNVKLFSKEKDGLKCMININ